MCRVVVAEVVKSSREAAPGKKSTLIGDGCNLDGHERLTCRKAVRGYTQHYPSVLHSFPNAFNILLIESEFLVWRLGTLPGCKRDRIMTPALTPGRRLAYRAGGVLNLPLR